MQLCYEFINQTPNMEARLRCRLVTRNHPSLFLQPLKIEEQSSDPMIVVIHDLLTDRQTDILRQLGEPKVNKTVVNRAPTERNSHHVRFTGLTRLQVGQSMKFGLNILFHNKE